MKRNRQAMRAIVVFLCVFLGFSAVGYCQLGMTRKQFTEIYPNAFEQGNNLCYDVELDDLDLDARVLFQADTIVLCRYKAQTHRTGTTVVVRETEPNNYSVYSYGNYLGFWADKEKRKVLDRIASENKTKWMTPRRQRFPDWVKDWVDDWYSADRALGQLMPTQNGKFICYLSDTLDGQSIIVNKDAVQYIRSGKWKPSKDED